MESSTSDEQPLEIWRLIVIECADDRRTLFSMLLLNKTMFQIVVPILYSKLPTTIEPFKNVQRLEWLLGFSAGLYSDDKLPVAVNEGDPSWPPFTNPLMANYYSFVDTVYENWLLQPFMTSWTPVPVVETDNVRTARLQHFAIISERWTTWVEYHAEKLQSLTLTPYYNWTPELNLDRITNIVHRFKSLKHVRIWPDPHPATGQTSRWDDEIEGSREFCDRLVRFITAHRAHFPGSLACGGIEIALNMGSTLAWQLWRRLLSKNVEAENRPKTLKIDLFHCSRAEGISNRICMEAAESLTMICSNRNESRVMSDLLRQCGPQLRFLNVVQCSDDWLAWARTMPEEEERARIRREWQATQELYRVWDLIDEGDITEPEVIAPFPANVAPLHRPLFPRLETLIIKGLRVIPILDALSIFRNSIQTVKICFGLDRVQEEQDCFGWTWELPKLESLTVQLLNLSMDSLSSRYCPNLRILSLKTYRGLNDTVSRDLGRESLKSLRALEELYLSDDFDFRKTYAPLEDHRYNQDSWNISNAQGFDFPYLRKVNCQGRWAVWVQGGFMAVAPRLETLMLDSSESDFSQILDVASFYEGSEPTPLGRAQSEMIRPFMRLVELKYWKIKNDQLALFEQIFVPLATQSNELLQSSYVVCPRLWSIDLQYISGVNSNRLVENLMRNRSELRTLKVHQIGELDLILDAFRLRWDITFTSQTASQVWLTQDDFVRLSKGKMKALAETSQSDVDQVLQFSFSGLRSKVGQCVLHYMGVQYVL